MPEILTIWNTSSAFLDERVNAAIREGWELTRRDVFIGPDHLPFFYAELERVVEAETIEDDFDAPAHWLTTRNPAKPLRCSNCGYEETSPKPVCPNCIRVMEDV